MKEGSEAQAQHTNPKITTSTNHRHHRHPPDLSWFSASLADHRVPITELGNKNEVGSDRDEAHHAAMRGVAR